MSFRDPQFASALAIGSTLLFGLVPALRAGRADLREQLVAGNSMAPPAGRRFRRGLVVTELSFATMLLLTAALLMRSFVALIDVDRGYRTENVLALTVQAWGYYPTSAQRRLFVDETLERIEALPGVLAAGVTSSLPLAESIDADDARFEIFGQPLPAAGGALSAQAASITEGYFRAMDIPLLAGRSFASTDSADAPPVMMINEIMARRHWPGEDSLGARVTIQYWGEPLEAEVIGIVGDVRTTLDADPQPSFYVPHSQAPTGALHFTVRSAGDPTALVGAVQNEIWAMNPAMPLAAVRTLDGLFDESLSARRTTLILLLAFSITALALAAIGTYGVLSHESSRRSREIGVRVALGAQRRRVVGLVVSEGLRLSLIGIVVGGLLALVASRVLSQFLFGIGSFDLVAFLGVAILMVIVTSVASLFPALRAARNDPVQTLRS